MILPDHYGCDRHDPKDFVVYQYTSGRVEKRCLACRRERHAKTHNGGERCRKGAHLKTPFTWRHYGPRQFGRCLPCQYERRRQKQREQADGVSRVVGGDGAAGPAAGPGVGLEAPDARRHQRRPPPAAGTGGDHGRVTPDAPVDTPRTSVRGQQDKCPRGGTPTPSKVTSKDRTGQVSYVS